MDSKLQIISGMYRGRKLRLPKNARPTQKRARIALFNMMESGIINNLDELRVWDAFAGSGAFGLECLSRYPNATVVFTDVSPESIKTVRDNLALLQVGARATVVQDDAIHAITNNAKNMNLIFVDAPYDYAELGRAVVAGLGKTVLENTVLIWEQEATNAVEPDTNIWNVLRDKTYGRARFFILQKK